MASILEREIRAYEARKDELVSKSAGKFALVKDDRVVSVFDTEADAINEGYRQFGNTPFLVKEIVALETPLYFTSNVLGI
jgi:hypothetical protein